MECFICTTCGTQHSHSPSPPPQCRICLDDRQYVGAEGQRWTTHAELASSLQARVEHDGAFLGIGIQQSFAIPQRALLVPTAAGTVMWDCISVVTDDALDAVRRSGPVACIAVSHPHFYSSMVEWSDALGGVPILLHADDAEWVMRPAPQITHWHGNSFQVAPGASLVHLPGHFPGSTALHRSDPLTGRSALLVGDSLHVCADRRHITVMHSVPNYVPVGPATIHRLQDRLAGLHYDDVYGFTWGLNIIGDGSARVAASLDRYLAAVTDTDTTAPTRSAGHPDLHASDRLRATRTQPNWPA